MKIQGFSMVLINSTLRKKVHKMALIWR